MELTKYKLGNLIELVDHRNENLDYGLKDVRGISIKKEFIETKANMEGVSLSSYKIVSPNDFAYVTVTSRNGKQISLALNKSQKHYLVSSTYLVFRLKNSGILIPDYLYIYFNRPEFDRFSRYNSWGSARETFDWNEMQSIEIELPSIEIQQKYVDIYNAMIANQKSYEHGLDSLFNMCMVYIENLRKRTDKLFKIGSYITPYNVKNIDGKITLEQGINIKKEFITPQRPNSNPIGRRIVRRGQFAYCTQLNNENVAIAYRYGEDCVVSSVYDVFEIKDRNLLIPEYLMLWLIRPEFGRYVYWASEGSAYEFLNFNNLANYKIPVPSLEIQKSIADIYNSYLTRKRINEQLKEQIKSICPILIKGSIEETRKA